MTKKTERQRQQEGSIIVGHSWLYEFRCNDGERFAAVAVSESGARRVLEAERPGIYAEVVRSRKAITSDFRDYSRAAGLVKQ